MIDAAYEGCISRSVVEQSLVIPNVRHVSVLLLFVLLDMWHVTLGPKYMG